MAEPRMEGLGFSPLELAGRRAVAGRGGGVQGSPCGQLLAGKFALLLKWSSASEEGRKEDLGFTWQAVIISS